MLSLLLYTSYVRILVRCCSVYFYKRLYVCSIIAVTACSPDFMEILPTIIISFKNFSRTCSGMITIAAEKTEIQLE